MYACQAQKYRSKCLEAVFLQLISFPLASARFALIAEQVAVPSAPTITCQTNAEKVSSSTDAQWITYKLRALVITWTMGHFKSTRKSSLLLAPFAYREFARSSFNGSALERPSLAPRGYAVPLQLPVDAGRQRLFLLYRQDAWRRKYAFISDSSGMQLGGCCKVNRKPCEELQWGTLVALRVWTAPRLCWHLVSGSSRRQKKVLLHIGTWWVPDACINKTDEESLVFGSALA